MSTSFKNLYPSATDFGDDDGEEEEEEEADEDDAYGDFLSLNDSRLQREMRLQNGSGGGGQHSLSASSSSSSSSGVVGRKITASRQRGRWERQPSVEVGEEAAPEKEGRKR
jgi:hypothetical protein